MFDSVPRLMASPGVVLVAGIVLLLWGNKLYHLLLGLVGFAFGWVLVQQLGLGGPPWLELAGGLFVGLLCVAFAFFLQKLALTVGGALLGGFGALWLAQSFGLPPMLEGQMSPTATGWIVGIAGAVAGVFLLHGVFRLGLAVLTSWLGAGFVLQTLPLGQGSSLLVGAILVLFGVAAQLRGGRDEEAGSRRRERKRERKHQRRLSKIERRARRRAAAGSS